MCVTVSSKSAPFGATLARAGSRTRRALPWKVVMRWCGQGLPTKATTNWPGDEDRRYLAGTTRPHGGQRDPPVRVCSLAKTITDCFKPRSKVGLDVALEALREARQQRKVTMDDLWRYAKVNRMTNVMRPYLEAMTG
jgi:hypothetical protein